LKGEIKMKHTIVTTIILLAVVIFINANLAFAENRVTVFEMAESGVTIEFPMTPEEIAAEDLKNARIAEIKEDDKQRPRARLKVIEMGESGQTVTFAMNAEEIASEDAEFARLAAIRAAKSRKSQNQVVKFELAESGIIIEFPEKSTFETALADRDLR
jgi:hypothetical protein